MYIKNILLSIFCLGSFFCNYTVNAQTGKKQKHKIRSVYFSWGYNKEWYTNSTVHVEQDGLGNYYKLIHAEAHDHIGWDGPHIMFDKALTIPQYNYRLGFFINEKQDLAIELNFDHTKYIISDGQSVQLKGTFNHRPTDSAIVFAQGNGDYYFLNNGANFFLINLVQRKNVYRSQHNDINVDFLVKAGIGPVIPHVQNSFFGMANDPHFQFGGWNTGLETALKATIYRYAYLEFSQKFDYARYSNLQIYQGFVRQNFGTYELILSIGVNIPAIKHDPVFMANSPGSK